MIKKEFKYWLLAILAIVIASCHSSAPKVTVQSIQKKDTVNGLLHTQKDSNTIQVVEVLDTIIKKDTIKISRNSKGVLKCSINSLSDTFLWKGTEWKPKFDWDFKSEAYNIITPDGKRSRILIENDSLLLFSQTDADEYNLFTVLFLVNRTKTSLKFASPIY
jgi:hypothetical protein